MTKKWDIDRITRAVISLAVVVLLYLLIRRLSGVLLPSLISMLIAYLLNPLVDFLQHKCRLKYRILSVFAALLISVGILTGLIAALATPISRQIQQVSVGISEYVQNFSPNQYLTPEMNEQLRELMQSIDIKIDSIDVSPIVGELKAQTAIVTTIRDMLDSVIGRGGSSIHTGAYLKVMM